MAEARGGKESKVENLGYLGLGMMGVPDGAAPHQCRL